MQPLVAEAAKRSAVLWLRAQGAEAPPRPLWHLWENGVAYVITGGSEQPAPEGLAAGAVAEMTLRSKDDGSRLFVLLASVDVVAAGSPEWEALLPTLLVKRLNALDLDRAAARWAVECTVFALRPTGELLEAPAAVRAS